MWWRLVESKHLLEIFLRLYCIYKNRVVLVVGSKYQLQNINHAVSGVDVIVAADHKIDVYL